MLDGRMQSLRFDRADSAWARTFSLTDVKCLIVCRGPVRKEAIQVFDEVGVRSYGMLLSEKDSIVYPRCLAPELRGFRFPQNVHRVPDYMGSGQEEKTERIHEIIAIAKDHGYTHVFAGYGFMAEDAEFIEAIEQAGLCFVGPASRVARSAGAKDEAKKLARKLGNSVTPGVDNLSALALLARAKDKSGLTALAKRHDLTFGYDAKASLEDNAEALLQAGYARTLELVTIEELQAAALEHSRAIWKQHPGSRIRYKYIGGGGGKGQRVVAGPDEVATAVMDVLAESKVIAPGSNRNFLIELNVETTRHNEIQLIGNGQWCVSLGGRDCSVQMHEQKLLEVSLTRELLDAEIAAAGRDRARVEVLSVDRDVLARMEAEAERFGAAVALDSVSTFESIVEGDKHFFMEMNTRIQVEHRVTELAYRLRFANPSDPSDCFYVESLIEAMLLLAVHGPRVPKPTRVVRHVSGAEVRINATNAALQPHAGGLIRTWSPPLPEEIRDDQGIGVRNPDTGAFVYYNLAGAYDSNIALVVTSGSSRRDNLERLSEILRRTELRGDDLQTNMAVHYGLINWILGKDSMVKPSTRFMTAYLAAVGAVATIAQDVDLERAWQQIAARHRGGDDAKVLRRKETLITRPLARLLSNAHVLAGFIGRFDGVLWQRSNGRAVFAQNPVRFLDELYRYLNLEDSPRKPPSEKIWEHDQRILTDALAFYAAVAERTRVSEWSALRTLLEGPRNAAVAEDDAHWAACQAAHRGFQLGMELLLIVPRIGMQTDFVDVVVGPDLGVSFPERFRDAKSASALIKALAPPPAASSDEIVTPMGGHFYAREAPHLPVLIEEGQHFEVGQPLFVIEVMKMFNKVLAPFSGTITKNLMRNADGQIVSKGQPVFKIAPDEVLQVESAAEKKARRDSVTLGLLADRAG